MNLLARASSMIGQISASN